MGTESITSDWIKCTELQGSPIYDFLLRESQVGRLYDAIQIIAPEAGFDYKYINNWLYLKLVDEQKYLVWCLSQ